MGGNGLRAAEVLRRRAKRPVRQLLRHAGYEIVPMSQDESAVVAKLVRDSGIELLLDVGANQGQYAERMRAAGYAGEIASFEPGSDPYRYLERAARRDPGWTSHRLAVGNAPGTLTLNVSANSVSSSLLDITDRHVNAERRSIVVDREEVDVVRLDAQVPFTGRRTMVKIDTQGFEMPVLEGLGDLVQQVELLQVELSLVELYEGQASYLEVLAVMDSMGFAPALVIPGFSDPASGHMLQLDVVGKKVVRGG